MAEFASTDAAFRALDEMNRCLEAALSARDVSRIYPEALPPVLFIVGVPRSGTTLVHQLMARGLRVEYVDQVVARFWRAPLFGRLLSRELLGTTPGRRIQLESDYGVGRGLEGPHEFGYFWNRWMNFDMSTSHNLTPEEQRRVDWGALRDAIASQLLGDLAGDAFLFKNLTCGFQAQRLASIFPNSAFVDVRRATGPVAQSLLHARMSVTGDCRNWLSLKPRSFPELSEVRDPVEQVVRQVVDSRRELDEQLRPLSGRVVRMEYESLTADPRGAVASAHSTLTDLGISLRCDTTLVPEHLQSRGGFVSANIQRELAKWI